MDDGIARNKTYPLWIHWSDHILSFHEVAGFERIHFSTQEERMDYVFQKTSHGFRIQ